MNFDRNTVIGLVLLGLVLIGFFWYSSYEQGELQKQRIEQARKDSADRARNQPKPTQQAVVQDTSKQNQVVTLDSNDVFRQAKQTPVKETVVETKLLRVVFSNRGGQPDYVELKNFKAPDSTNVKLGASETDKITYPLAVGNGTESAGNLYFTGGDAVLNADSSYTITYELNSGDGKTIRHQYVVHPDNYMIDFNLDLSQAANFFPNNNLLLLWKNKAMRLQKDLSYEKQMSEVAFYADNEFDYYKIASRTEKEFTDPVKWVAVKQQFFNSALVAKDKEFSSGRLDWTAPNDSNTIADVSANLKFSLAASNKLNLGLYYGPTEYKILKQYGNDMEDMVDLGRGLWAFVKYINRWIVIPVFNLFSQLTSNFGIVILLLTLFIRLLISPLTYSSYLSGAKMKVLRPEIEQLKAKYGNDQQQISMEQMKLFREAGVNPLGGCIPALLQIPIFFALYSFFNSNVALRGKSFLWSDDLSQYDSIAHLPFSIPFYGDHVSLFTITAVVTSFLISLYSMSMTPDQSNPVLKFMPYIFPVLLLFFFNNLPSGLTWYYTVSNIITLALQFVIQNYIINHEKILAKMEENRKKPKKQSKFQERLAQMQEQQKQMRDMQNKKGR